MEIALHVKSHVAELCVVEITSAQLFAIVGHVTHAH
jgi:hypothetical protein